MTQGTISEYERARARVEKKRKFRGDVVTYIVVNAFLVAFRAGQPATSRAAYSSEPSPSRTVANRAGPRRCENVARKSSNVDS